MTNLRQRITFIILLCFFLSSQAQYVHQSSTQYTYPEDAKVREKLHQWQDQKFGMLIHWGIYSVSGVIESWIICSEQEDWIPRDSTIAYDDYKRQYWELSKQFKPTKFDPAQWAQTANDAGMRYAIFTTKHHDGFNMFNTSFSDFSISKGPFKDDPRSDVAKHVFDAFRKENMMIGAYFSKPDWHSDYYWWKRYATPNRSQNYSIEKHPWRWKQFNEFTYNQISELMHNYGSLDILWLDGGWVNMPGTPSMLDMPRIANMAREAQPGILIVDRTIHGKYENYQTPEQHIPAEQLPYPWETCLTLGKDWGYTPDRSYKSPTTVISKLIEIVAKGGSLLLGVGPTPEGLIQDEVVLNLRSIGSWMKANGEAIYETTPTPVYESNGTWFTANKNGKTLYALHAVSDNGSLPSYIEWKGNAPIKGSTIKCLSTNKKVKWEKRGDTTRVYIPKDYKPEVKAITFAFTIN